MPKKPRYFKDAEESAKKAGKEVIGDKPDPKARSFYYDEVEEFQHDKDEVRLTAGKSAQGRRSWKTLKSKEVEEIFPIAEDSDLEESENEDEDESDVDMESDLDSNEDYLPSADAWGKKRSAYYHTDYVDKDYGGFSGSEEEEAALLEETEAKTLQRKHYEQMSEEDFQLDSVIPSTSTMKEKVTSSDIDQEKVPFDALTCGEKLKVFKTQSPEYFQLLEEFKAKKKLLEEITKIFNLVKDQSDWATFPLLKFLSRYANIISNQKRINAESSRNGETKPVATSKDDLLLNDTESKVHVDHSLIDSLLNRLTEGESLSYVLGSFNMKKSIKSAFHKGHNKIKDLKEHLETGIEDEFEDDDGKRRITYQMAKNKGLMPHRKKEQNNPRVKHKLKYRKALIKRRSQVPDCKTEMERYGGEARGIKIGVIRSRKLQ